jgi:hypothetical protein
MTPCAKTLKNLSTQKQRKIMTDKQNHPKPSPKHQLLLAQLAELKLTQIAEIYAQVLDDAARKNSAADCDHEPGRADRSVSRERGFGRSG